MRRLVLLGSFQVGVILAWAGYHEHIRATAPTFRIPLQPVDPYDVLRGRYFVLKPSDGRIKTGEAPNLLAAAEVQRFLGKSNSFHGRALVGFCPERELWRVCALTRLDDERQPEPASFWSRGIVTIQWEEVSFRGGKSVPAKGWGVNLDLGAGRFFLPSRVKLPAGEREPGWELEVSHRPGLAPLPRRLFFRGTPVDVGER